MAETIYWDVAMTERYVPTTKYFVGVEEEDSGETWILRPHPQDFSHAYGNSVRSLASGHFIKVYRECCPEANINGYTIFETEKYDQTGNLLRPFSPVLHVLMTPRYVWDCFVSEDEIHSGFKVIKDEKRNVASLLGKDYHAWWNFSLACHEVTGTQDDKGKRYAVSLGGKYRYPVLDGAETLVAGTSGKWKVFTPAARPLLFPSSQQDRGRSGQRPSR